MPETDSPASISKRLECSFADTERVAAETLALNPITPLNSRVSTNYVASFALITAIYSQQVSYAEGDVSLPESDEVIQHAERVAK